MNTQFNYGRTRIPLLMTLYCFQFINAFDCHIFHIDRNKREVAVEASHVCISYILKLKLSYRYIAMCDRHISGIYSYRGFI